MSEKNQQFNKVYSEQSVDDTNISNDIGGSDSPSQSSADFSVETNMSEKNLESGVGGNGWIKIHRKILDNPIASKPVYLALFVHLLLLANHDEGKPFLWNGSVIIQKAGQFITGRKSLSANSGIPESTVEDILKVLEKLSIIRQQKTTKYRCITILNWETYQKSDNKATTKQQQADTIKNYKNYKKTSNSKESQGLNDIIKLFEGVNPTYESIYKNTTERKALEQLIKKFGREKIESTIRHLPEYINKPYAPKITRPTELLRDLGKLVAFTNQEKGKLSTKSKGFV